MYIIALPFFGVIGEVIPVFSRRPLFGYKAFVLSSVFIGAYSMTVWAHHMFTTGFISLPFFAATSFIIAVPTGVKFFNWIATMWRGRLTFPTPMLWAVGFLFTFLFGGITGVLLVGAGRLRVPGHVLRRRAPPQRAGRRHLRDVGGITFWFPKVTGRRLDERLGKTHFWLWSIGFVLTFLPRYQLGASGMPRRYADYPADAGWTEAERALDDRRADHRGVGAGVPRRGRRGAPPAAGHAGRPVGGELARVGDQLATAAPGFRSVPYVRSEQPVFDARVEGPIDDPRAPMRAPRRACRGPAAG